MGEQGKPGRKAGRQLQKPLGQSRRPRNPSICGPWENIPDCIRWMKGLKQSRPQTLLHLCPNSAISMSINNIQMGPIASVKLVSLLDGGHSLHLPPLPVGRCPVCLGHLGRILLIFIYLPPGLAENRTLCLCDILPTFLHFPFPKAQYPYGFSRNQPDDFIGSREMTFLVTSLLQPPVTPSVK